MSVRIARVEGITLQRAQAMMVAVSPDECFKIDGSFDSNQREEICIDLYSSEERNSLTQRRERNEGHQGNRKARPKPLRKGGSNNSDIAHVLLVLPGVLSESEYIKPA